LFIEKQKSVGAEESISALERTKGGWKGGVM
jgi:hypothetical protein